MSCAALARKKSAEPASRSQAATTAFGTGLRIGEANDQFERDADRAADDIMEGQHYPYPAFTGKSGMKVDDFKKAKEAHNKAVSDWGRAFNKVKLQGDCVGTTIVQFHKGEKGYTNICP